MDHGSPTELRTLIAHLSALLAVQEETNANLRAQFANVQSQQRRRTVRHGRNWLGSAVLASFLALVPLGLMAANPFTDLTGGVHDANIDAIYNAGITTGCVPNVAYCPTDFVTREQMASFLARTAGLGGNPPVANAANAVNATNAQNASTIGGYVPNGLIRAAQGKGPGVFDPVELDANFQPIAVVEIQAPGPGLILVSGVASLSSASGCPCRADLHLRDTKNDIEAPTLFANLGPSAGAVYQLSVSPVWVFQVSRGGVQTFQLEGKRASGNGTPTAVNSAITAIFIPFGQDGNVPVGQP